MTAATRKKRKTGPGSLSGYLFAAPYALVFLVFILVPVALAVICDRASDKADSERYGN